MQIGLSRVSLNDVQGGVLGTGIVPIPRTVRAVVNGTAAGAIALSSVMQTVFQLDCGTIVAGDVILLMAQFSYLADVGAGRHLAIADLQDGTSTVVCQDGFPGFTVSADRVAFNDFHRSSAFGLCRCTVGGTWLPKIIASDLDNVDNSTNPALCALGAMIFYGG